MCFELLADRFASAYVQEVIDLRPPFIHELARMSELCMRSKAYWAYDDDSMQSCEAELTVHTIDLDRDKVIVALDKACGRAGFT